MLVSSVIYYLLLSLILKAINCDEAINDVEKTYNNIDDKSLKAHKNTIIPNKSQKGILPFKPFKPIKGTTKPSLFNLGNKKPKKNVTTTIKPNIEVMTTTGSPMSDNEKNDIEVTTTQAPEEINLQTIAIEPSSIIDVFDNTESTTQATTDKLSTSDYSPTCDNAIEEYLTTISTQDDKLTNTQKDKNSGLIDMEYSEICVHRYEYHAIDGECDTFIECKKRVAFKSKCPEGLLFNSIILWPDYPCSYPNEVECNGKITQSSNPTEECKHQYGFFPYSKQNCSQYIMCQEGKAFPLSCPAGLVFNTDTNSCDWPANVPNCQSSALDMYDCTASSSEGAAELKYRYGNSCREYVLCLEGHPRLLKCDFGLAFDDEQGFCVNSEYVQNCA